MQTDDDLQQICAQYYDALFNASENNSILKFGCDLPHIPSEMLVREAYVELHNRIHKDPKTSALILGNSGIGKSYFSFYELLRLFRELVEKKSEGVIVYESVPLNLFMVLNAEKVDCVCDISQRYSLWQIARVSYYLFDAGTKAQPTPQLSGCKAIVFSSPDRRNYIDFQKNQKPQVLLFYMPVWSLDELRLLPNPNGINVDERFQLFGGIPRYVFDSEYTRRDLDIAISESDVSDIYKFAGKCDVGENSHKIFQLVVDTTSYKERSVGFASPYVVQKYYQKLEESVMHSPLRIQWQDKTFLSAVRGQLFKVWAHKKLVQGGSFTVRHLGTGEETTLHLPQMISEIFSSLTELREHHSFDNNAYLQPTQSNFVSVDSFAGDKLFRMTVGKEHTLKVEELNECLLAIGRPPSQHFCLYFVVPDDIFDDCHAFRRKQNYVTKAGGIASRIPPLVNSIQQYVLRLSLDKLCPESA